MAAKTYQVQLLDDGAAGRVAYTPSGSDVAAGDVVITNGMFQFAPQKIADGDTGTLRTAGGPPAIRIVKATGAVSVGNAVYWDADGDPVGGTAGTGAATTTSTSNTLIGRCIAAAASGDQTVDVELTVGVITQGGALQAAIADPGDAGAIPVTNSGYCPIVTGGSETRTLAIPTFIGQELLLYIKTDGGTCVITTATAINQTGNNTITMADVRDSIRLQAIESGANLVWDVVAANGAALSTV